ncbi:iron-sulfur cluster assembly protein [Pseudonocardia xishanensis]|uniref:Iron-sulfur cluster assembly protein n=1 Tax=Pseudonocardia xishanensis TaxID=630995 RepID=A0ABP8RLS8_9PSEU
MTVTDDRRAVTARTDEAWAALDAVVDPELDEPITDLKFVRSLDVVGADVVVHLRLPTSFCAPNFAYLMASDAKDVLVALPWTRRVTVELDDHHDSDLINRGLAADAGYRGTFGHEAEEDLSALRLTFQRKAHTAAMERVLTRLVRAGSSVADLGRVTIGDLPDDDATRALLRRRAAIGLRNADALPVFVNHTGSSHATVDLPLQLRLARSTRISIEGNAHFCRGLLATRYDLEEHVS